MDLKLRSNKTILPMERRQREKERRGYNSQNGPSFIFLLLNYANIYTLEKKIVKRQKKKAHKIRFKK